MSALNKVWVNPLDFLNEIQKEKEEEKLKKAVETPVIKPIVIWQNESDSDSLEEVNKKAWFSPTRDDASKTYEPLKDYNIDDIDQDKQYQVERPVLYDPSKSLFGNLFKV